MRKLFKPAATVASGAAIGMIVAKSELAVVAGIVPTKTGRWSTINSPRRRSSSREGVMPPELNKYAGDHMDAGAEAKAYADNCISRYLEGSGREGKSYSEVCRRVHWRSPDDKELAAQRRTACVIGETLRGMLPNAWGWGTLGVRPRTMHPASCSS